MNLLHTSQGTEKFLRTGNGDIMNHYTSSTVGSVLIISLSISRNVRSVFFLFMEPEFLKLHTLDSFKLDNRRTIQSLPDVESHLSCPAESGFLLVSAGIWPERHPLLEISAVTSGCVVEILIFILDRYKLSHVLLILKRYMYSVQ